MEKLNNRLEIKELIEKYFAGKTNRAEENKLRAYFSSDEVAEELKAEQSYFLALSQLRENAKQEYSEGENYLENQRKNRFARRFIPLSAAAAIAGLIAVSVFIFQNRNNGNYLIVNGIKTKDKEKMEEMFHASLESAKIETDDILEILKD
jgi:uncharacterized membrane protein YvbJ